MFVPKGASSLAEASPNSNQPVCIAGILFLHLCFLIPIGHGIDCPTGSLHAPFSPGRSAFVSGGPSEKIGAGT